MTSRLRNLEQRFTHRQPTSETEKELHELLSNKFVEFVDFLNKTLDESRSKSLMLTELETASSWAHKALDDTVDRLEEAKSKTTTEDTTNKPSAKKSERFNYRKPGQHKPGNNKFNYRKPGPIKNEKNEK